MSGATAGIVLYRVKGGGDEAILLDPAPAANEVENGERLSKGQAANLLGIRRDELAELVADGLLALREGVDGKPYVRSGDLRRFVDSLEAVPFVEAQSADADEDQDDDDDEDEDEVAVVPAKAKPAAKDVAAGPVAEAEEADEDETDLSGEVTFSGPAGALSAFFRNLFGSQAEEAESTEEEAEPATDKPVKVNPTPARQKSSRRSGR